jgi:hypothetical protein
MLIYINRAKFLVFIIFVTVTNSVAQSTYFGEAGTGVSTFGRSIEFLAASSKFTPRISITTRIGTIIPLKLDHHHISIALDYQYSQTGYSVYDKPSRTTVKDKIFLTFLGASCNYQIVLPRKDFTLALGTGYHRIVRHRYFNEQAAFYAGLRSRIGNENINRNGIFLLFMAGKNISDHSQLNLQYQQYLTSTYSFIFWPKRLATFTLNYRHTI